MVKGGVKFCQTYDSQADYEVPKCITAEANSKSISARHSGRENLFMHEVSNMRETARLFIKYQ
jgi:hypothetical protein